MAGGPTAHHMITTCQCEHCGGAVEFELDQWQEGAIGDCPHCKAETRLRRIEIYAPPAGVAKNRKEMMEKLDRPAPRWRPCGIGGETVLFLGGFILIGAAAFDVVVRLVGLSETSIILIGCTGILLVGLGQLAATLRNIAEKP